MDFANIAHAFCWMEILYILSIVCALWKLLSTVFRNKKIPWTASGWFSTETNSEDDDHMTGNESPTNLGDNIIKDLLTLEKAILTVKQNSDFSKTIPGVPNGLPETTDDVDLIPGVPNGLPETTDDVDLIPGVPTTSGIGEPSANQRQKRHRPIWWKRTLEWFRSVGKLLRCNKVED